MIILNNKGRIYSGMSYKAAAPSENKFISAKISQKLKQTGDTFVFSNDAINAEYYYEEAIRKKSAYADPYYNLAKIYEKTDRPEQALNTYKKLLEVKPDETEAQTLVGIYHKNKEDYGAARQMFKKALEIDPKYDFAARSLKETDYIILARSNPKAAEALKEKTEKENIKEALSLINQYCPASLTKRLNKVNVEFNKTDLLSGHRNIAQYEHKNKRIILTGEYIWSAPVVTAAYLVHEAVHARDNDDVSSIREEQDAYEESVKFWINHSNGIKDPELDYAAALYKENPQKLREKVGSTYRERDPSMREFSPNHTPEEGLGAIAAIKIKLSKLKNTVNNFFIG